MRRRRDVTLAIAAATLLAGGGLWAADRARAETVSVEPATIAERVVARAVIVPRQGVAEVRPRVDGRVLSVAVNEGEAVKAGQLLAEIEPDSARAEVARREAEVASLDSTARAVRQGARTEEVSAAQAEVRAAREELSLARERLAREERLGRTGASPPAQVEEARRAAEIVRARLDGAEARLRLARSGGRPAETSAADARVAAARAAAELAKLDLGRTRLVAPIDGRVLARRVDPGDTVAGAQAGGAPAAFELADTQDTELRLEIEEVHAAQVPAGTHVRVVLPGGRDQVGSGRVVRLGARLERRTIGAQDARERGEGWVRAVWAEVAWPGGPPPLGQRFEAILELGQRHVDASVPRGAVRVAGGRALVDRARGPLFEETAVVLGMADDERVEVQGLPAGTLVRAAH
ncbi:MAG: HlyD family efflux transporter periplasmic adaptor subunit [Polyangiaceae bacterium]|nr:HlyD family efflux transporter periplasmic adaptor subunit [Polyangiaceae bacterium]